MVQSISAEAIENATGKPFDYWVELLNGRSAADLSHKEIARLLQDDAGVSAWWAQMLTVAYEQHIGRRVPGQDCNGVFTLSVTKTLSGSMDDALAWWLDLVDGRNEFSDVAVTRGPDISETDKWRYWRIGLGDGSRVNVNIYQKDADKASLGIQHDKLESQEQIEHWRAFWKAYLKGS